MLTNNKPRQLLNDPNTSTRFRSSTILWRCPMLNVVHILKRNCKYSSHSINQRPLGLYWCCCCCCFSCCSWSENCVIKINICHAYVYAIHREWVGERESEGMNFDVHFSGLYLVPCGQSRHFFLICSFFICLFRVRFFFQFIFSLVTAFPFAIKKKIVSHSRRIANPF